MTSWYGPGICCATTPPPAAAFRICTRTFSSTNSRTLTHYRREIAFYLAAKPDANMDGREWHTVPLTPGKLFIVGDSKQSIYRFRRADIGVTHLVRESGQLSPLTLTENRRSQKPVLDWINALFSQIMTAEPGLQAEYIPLQLNPGLQRHDLESSMQVFGEPLDLSADALRGLQARHVASIIVGLRGRRIPQPSARL